MIFMRRITKCACEDYTEQSHFWRT